MFKPSPALRGVFRRDIPLSTKQAGKEYYKGNRVGSMGTIDKWGRFHPDYSKIRTFVYPVNGLRGFELTPFVSKDSPRFIEDIEDGKRVWKTAAKGPTGEEYLNLWKTEGGHDDVALPQEETERGSKKNMPDVWEEPATKP